MTEPQPVYPSRHVPLARGDGPRWLHAAELASCLALGQRALLVGPHRTGKTTLLREIGQSVAAACPDASIFVVLVDQPLEEALEWRYEVPGAQVKGTSSDDDPDDHVRVDGAFDQAREVCERGGDAVVLVDSIAALARALNATMPYDERILTGGIMQTALKATRSLFGSARALELPDGTPAGSITVIATADVDTERELDDVVFHELVGTGNMEIRLNGDVRDAHLLPALDIAASGARHTESILGHDEADRRAELRARIASQEPATGLAMLLDELDRAGTLEALLDSVAPG